ncbi:MAG TPA: GNAT family N-acetyltransferase, partial [Telluria sp.]|nr:GNAT family N-acetyltransferase [Telluria sp.]
DALLAPNVSFFVARDARGEALGCGACVDQGGYAEIKRMYVAPSARGQGAARALMRAIEGAAVARGLSTLRLETGIHQPEAIALYERTGYERRGPFGAYQADPLSIFMEKTLA